MKIGEVVDYLNSLAPPVLQQSYDNSGLLLGDPGAELTGVLIALDVTEAVIGEAVNKGLNLVVSHHPLIFKGLKSLTGADYVEKAVIHAIQHRVAVHAMHTNLDVLYNGVNRRICEKLGLTQLRVLSPRRHLLRKLVTFVPLSYADKVREAVFSAGAGTIGNYDQCSFNIPGQGSFRGSENTNPFAGEKGKLSFEDEIRIETIFPSYLEKAVIEALLSVHPYEEVAYDIYPLDNAFDRIGEGMTGILVTPLEAIPFLQHVKTVFSCASIRYAGPADKPIRTVAVCGGSGGFLIPEAIRQETDAFISSDFRYHQFFTAENKILIADIGHYESEQFSKEIIFEFLTKKYSNFAIHFSESITNPVKYL